MSLNKVQLIGNLGSDVEVKKFEGGGKIAQFSLATSETYKNKEGEKITNTTWHNIVSRFPKQADVLAKFLSKGDRIYLEGSINNRSYEKDGVKKYISEVLLRDFVFLTTKNSDGATTKPAAETPTDSEPDDLPF